MYVKENGVGLVVLGGAVVVVGLVNLGLEGRVHSGCYVIFLKVAFLTMFGRCKYRIAQSNIVRVLNELQRRIPPRTYRHRRRSHSSKLYTHPLLNKSPTAKSSHLSPHPQPNASP